MYRITVGISAYQASSERMLVEVDIQLAVVIVIGHGGVHAGAVGQRPALYRHVGERAVAVVVVERLATEIVHNI